MDTVLGVRGKLFETYYLYVENNFPLRRPAIFSRREKIGT